jgi:hypothetical protein
MFLCVLLALFAAEPPSGISEAESLYLTGLDHRENRQDLMCANFHKAAQKGHPKAKQELDDYLKKLEEELRHKPNERFGFH